MFDTKVKQVGEKKNENNIYWIEKITSKVYLFFI